MKAPPENVKVNLDSAANHELVTVISEREGGRNQFSLFFNSVLCCFVAASSFLALFTLLLKQLIVNLLQLNFSVFLHSPTVDFNCSFLNIFLQFLNYHYNYLPKPKMAFVKHNLP